MQIKSISEKIFRTSPNKIESNSNQTNPFGVNFKGKMINADVFETAKPSLVANLSEKVSNRSKMITSAIVGSIGDVNQAISRRLDSIVSFGKRMGEKAGNLWAKLNDTKLVINIGNNEDLFRLNLPEPKYRISNLKKLEISDLGSMFEEAVAAREAAWITIKN